MTMKRSVIKARVLEFADFLEQLPEEKFDHGTWFNPDYTCKSSACTAGWAAIKYSPKVQKYVKRVHDRQRQEAEIFEIKDYDEHNKQLKAFLKLPAIMDPNWKVVGRSVLGLSESTANTLFLPYSQFWKTAPKIKNSDYVSSKVMALVVRYLAYTPQNRFFHDKFECDSEEYHKDYCYNEDYLRSYIAQHADQPNVSLTQ